MARDTLDSTPIQSRQALISVLESGCKPTAAFRIGTEHEKFGFCVDTLKPIPYEGERGVRRVLEGMEGLLGWERIEDHGKIIGLADPVGGGAISIEPGGQFELSGAPVETLHQTCRETNSHLAQVREIAEPLGVGFLGVGMAPSWSRQDMPRMPKSRYDIMAAYMPKVGSYGLDMMFRTSTIQVNLDFSSEADMRHKMRVSLALQPIATAIFANSPFTDGKPNDFKSFRGEIWRDLDADRTGMLPFVFDEGFGFEQYLDWAVDVPMYFVKRGDDYHQATDVTFRQFMDGALADRLPDGVANIGDWNNHLSTLFPDVRLKQFLEMRGADGGPWRRICALPAFWVGLLYDQASLDQAWQLVRDWTSEEREALRRDVARFGLDAPMRNGTVRDIAKDALALSLDGLRRRNLLSDAGYDERQYLAPVEETIVTGMTPADHLLAKYHGDWQGDISRIFSEYAY
ncbi:MAG: glutamate--cysteine ligase [Stappiaceae bacterium]